MATLHLEIVTPMGAKATADISMITAPGSLGDLGILPGHRPLITSLGIGMAVAVLVSSIHWFDALDQLADVYFEQAQRQDLTVSFGQAEDAAIERSLAMRQAYLGGDGVSVRVRFEGDQARLNIKQMVIGPTRLEFEYTIPLADARRLIDLASGGGTEKIRHYVRHAGMLWEIDEFSGENEPHRGGDRVG